MKSVHKRHQLVEKLESHLRYTARHLIKFDSLEETLHYIINSFWVELPCDLVAIILKEKNVLKLKVGKGGSQQFEQAFPLSLQKCSTNILEEGWSIEKTRDGIQCDFHQLMVEEEISTWFTVPLKDDGISIGFCVVGFQNFVPLIAETERIFVEFGKDIAASIQLAQNKEIDKKKMESLKWFNTHLYPGSPIEQLVEKVVEMACVTTGATSANVYLYDDKKNCFFFQPPFKGSLKFPEKIWVGDNYDLYDHFPYLEKIAGQELTIPIIVNLKTIGVLHLFNKLNGNFIEEDLELLEFLLRHVATLLENARLYEIEIELKQQLERVIDYQKELVKQTLYGESLDAISRTLGTIFTHTIILFDRFFHPISYSLSNIDNSDLQMFIKQIQQDGQNIKKIRKRERWMDDPLGNKDAIGIWPVIGGGDLLGYLAVHINKEEVDDVFRLTIEHALSVYAIQFIKQKIAIDTKEQVKGSVVNQLFQEKMENQDKIIEYASLFEWDLFKPHRVAIVSIQTEKMEKGSSINLLDLEAQKTAVWEQVKEHLSMFDSDTMLTRNGDEFILIVPVSKEEKGMKCFWKSIYKYMSQISLNEKKVQHVFLGIGGKTAGLTDYYISYKQAQHAHHIVKKHLYDKGFSLFEDLGSYTLLDNLKDPLIAQLFIETYLEPLLHYQEGKGADLFTTLRQYTFNNGNWKKTMESLFIHRSTLRYRMERIKEILPFDIDSAENRLNVMIAYKLFDLYYEDSANKN